jgi:hypothetical protein
MFSNSEVGIRANLPVSQKKASFMNWMMSGMSRNHYSGGMNILLPAVFMAYQGFDPLPGHV